MISVEECQRRINKALASPQTCHVKIDNAVGCILAETISADRQQPPFNRVMMDGIAIAFKGYTDGCRRFLRQGIQAAGARCQTLTAPENCIEVMTGAALPEGADTIIPVEQLNLATDHAELAADYHPTQAQFVHLAGSDYQSGAALLKPGLKIGGPEMAVLASVGAEKLKVYLKPTIGLLAVGDELVDLGTIPGDTQIRRSNDYAISGLLTAAGFPTNFRKKLADNPQQLLAEIESALQSCDFLVLTGGVSMGKYDYIPSILQQLGVEIILHKVAQQPGKPMWLGRRDGKMVFALPGNPVSALVCARRYLLPALQSSINFHPFRQVTKIATPVVRHQAMTRFIPVQRLKEEPLMRPKLPNTSGDFYSLAGTDGFIELAPGNAPLEAGAEVPYWPW